MVERITDVTTRLWMLAREEPFATVLISLLGGLAVFALLLMVWRWWNQPPGKRFRNLIQRHDHITVLLHPNPDPDAMASAMGVEQLASDVGTSVKVVYPGRIAHQENRAFRTVLGVDFDRIESWEDLGPEPIVLLDHNTARGFVGSDRIEPIAVVDHHPGDGEGSAFTDVRIDYGATATILVEYLLNDDLAPDRVHMPSDLATGLLYGILSDTDHLTNGAADADFDAAARLSPMVDSDTVERIANPPVDASILDTVASAIRNRQKRGPFAIADVGEVKKRDAIPQAADKLRDLEGVTAVVVFGEYGEQLHFSGRSRDDRIHMGQRLSEFSDKLADGKGGAGGHARMGAGQVPLEATGYTPGGTNDEIVSLLFNSLGSDVSGYEESKAPIGSRRL